MAQQPEQKPVVFAPPDFNKTPEKKAWSQSSTNADKKPEADKSQTQGNCSSKS